MNYPDVSVVDLFLSIAMFIDLYVENENKDINPNLFMMMPSR